MSYKLFIPTVGDRLRLRSSWTFPLVDDSRNETLATVMNLRPSDATIEAINRDIREAGLCRPNGDPLGPVRFIPRDQPGGKIAPRPFYMGNPPDDVFRQPWPLEYCTIHGRFYVDYGTYADMRHHDTSNKFSALVNIIQANIRNVTVTIPGDTLLTIDRIYIRKGHNAAFNSMTFLAKFPDGSAAAASQQAGKVPRVRFFTSLEDVNAADLILLDAVEQ